MNAVNWFEIPANNIDRAMEFYKNILGYDLQKTNMMGTDMAFFPGEVQNQGATGAIIQGEGYEPSEKGSLVYFSAGEDLTPVLEKVEKAGGKVILPKTSIGEHGFIAHFMDCEGNRVALHSIG
ncbi:VOC family protein [Fulvivirgaceae bacterium BMA10]|uniref:VOC family protein n=1 Tax=Splendidivirga corallicola TaxID=3051826 RepID=A0ABT8KQ20_9BACT|nr:VOC family protein [Fulvivirgaceae bacterium BMA10]